MVVCCCLVRVKMRILVNEPSGSVLTFELDAPTVGTLKESVHNQEGVPCYMQSFSHGGQDLSDDGLLLSTLGEDEVTLNIQYKLSGGGPKCEAGECKCRIEVRPAVCYGVCRSLLTLL